ncbi:chalcone--flavonone isomerase [Amborella trichopoda]|nr:chalcone--flavonone isomerase [Amborella trichopoda]|eukprot:XP_006850622.2 chalcone--flavonone isomerase [Amborella trichopoda]
MEVEGVVFSTTVRPPLSSSSPKKDLALGGAGVRGVERGGVFVKSTCMALYMEEAAVYDLEPKWKGKSAEELLASPNFFMDIVNCPFQKMSHMAMISTLDGEEFSGKVVDKLKAIMEASGTFSPQQSLLALHKFLEAFKGKMLTYGSAIFFAYSKAGLLIAITEDGSVPEQEDVMIEDKALTQALLDSIIGEHGVSPAAKRSVAKRLSEALSKA